MNDSENLDILNSIRETLEKIIEAVALNEESINEIKEEQTDIIKRIELLEDAD